MVCVGSPATSQEEAPHIPDGKPNILVIWGDDIGIINLSCYSDGLMGYETPKIDHIANEGLRFTDDYGERKVLKGGSHLCTPRYCYRYRPSARQAQMIDTGMSHLGFRTVVRED